MDLAATVPPGSGNIIFTPWLSGERTPIADRHARGGFHNLSLVTNAGPPGARRPRGGGLQLPVAARPAEKFTGRRLDPIRLIGGGAQADLWCQILADVLDRRIETGGRASARQPARARRSSPAWPWERSAATRSARWSPSTRPSRPDPANRAVYDHLLAEFPRLYKANKRMFTRLNRSR